MGHATSAGRRRRGCVTRRNEYTRRGACPYRYDMTTFLVLGALVAVATALGLIWKSGQGKLRASATHSVIPAEFLTPGTTTLLQFTTEMCGPCAALKPQLQKIALYRSDITHREVDAVDHIDLASKLNIRSTPTTLIVSDTGEIRGRINGVAPARVFLDAVDGTPTATQENTQ